MKKFLIGAVVVVGLVGQLRAAQGTVKQYAAPGMVDEINAALTNLTAGSITAGNIPLARTTNVLISTGAGTTLAAFNGSGLTNLNASSLGSGTVNSNRLQANLTSLAANDGAGLTNLNAGNLGSGTVSSNRLQANLTSLSANDGAGLTNLSGAAIASGTVNSNRLNGSLTDLASYNGSGLTNLTATSLAGNIATAAMTNGFASDFAGYLVQSNTFVSIGTNIWYWKQVACTNGVWVVGALTTTTNGIPTSP